MKNWSSRWTAQPRLQKFLSGRVAPDLTIAVKSADCNLESPQKANNMDNRGKGKPTEERRVEKYHSRPTESKPARTDPIKKTVPERVNDILGNKGKAK